MNDTCWRQMNIAPHETRILLQLDDNNIVIGRFSTIRKQWIDDSRGGEDIEDDPIAWQALPDPLPNWRDLPMVECLHGNDSATCPQCGGER